MADPLAELARLEGVPSAVASARDAVDAVLRDRGLRAVTSQQSAEALLAGARASAELSGDPPRWLPGCVRVSTEMLELSQLVRRSPGQVLARVHTLLALGGAAEDQLGRLRPGAEVADRVRGLQTLLTTPTKAPAIVMAAVAHAELVAVAPFVLANGLVARAVEHLVLVADGVDPRAVIVVEAGHLALRQEYEQSLVAYGNGSVAGVREWLLHSSRSLARGAELSPLASPRP